MDKQQENKKLLLDIKDYLYKLQQDTSIIKLDIKVIKAKLEEKQKTPEPISKGWFG